MAWHPDDGEGAVREVARVYELIKTHQPLLLVSHLELQEPPTTTKLAQSLLSEALRALNIALSVMKQQQQDGNKSASPLGVKAEHQLSPSSPVSAAADSNVATRTSARSSKRRRPVVEGKKPSWVDITNVPYEDGFEWRKYGEKRINGTHFTRNYFRCTYKDGKGCQATKYIQQKDNSDPPVFEVTYNNEHTCNCTTASPPAKKNNLQTGGGASNPPVGHHDVTMMVHKETTVSPPPLADVSAVPLDDHHMQCQEPFPIGDHYVTADAGVPSATRSSACHDRSCILGVSCNEESDMGWVMPESLLVGHDPEFQDLELQLLYNSFKDYELIYYMENFCGTPK